MAVTVCKSIRINMLHKVSEWVRRDDRKMRFLSELENVLKQQRNRFARINALISVNSI